MTGVHTIVPIFQNMTRSRAASAVVILCGLLAAAPSPAAQIPWFKRSPSGPYVEFKDVGGRFSLERPKDWEAIPGASDTVVTFLEKKREAQIVVGRFRMARPLTADDVTDLFASEIEVPLLKSSQPAATNVTARLIRRDGQPIVVIDYERPGVKQKERARQYSLPRGQDNFRLTCSAVTARFAKFEPLFEHAVQSFRTSSLLASSGLPAAR
jgi:hypothetical protein